MSVQQGPAGAPCKEESFRGIFQGDETLQKGCYLSYLIVNSFCRTSIKDPWKKRTPQAFSPISYVRDGMYRDEYFVYLRRYIKNLVVVWGWGASHFTSSKL